MDERLPLPLFLELEQRPCLVVGGNEVLVTKVEALLTAGAVVTLVAATLAPALIRWAEQGKLTWRQEPFHPDHLKDAWLVVAAPGPGVDVDALATACAARRVFLNVVDLPSHCTATWPSVVQRPPVQAAFSTCGRSPALAGFLRRRLEEMLPMGQVAGLVTWLEGWRRISRDRYPDLAARAGAWESLMAQGVVELYLSGRQEAADVLLRRVLDKGEGQ